MTCRMHHLGTAMRSTCGTGAVRIVVQAALSSIHSGSSEAAL